MNPDAALEIAFDVPGWPPLKNEAKSMLAAGHKHHGSVRALLEAAAVASRQVGWTIVSADIALDVVVQAPAGGPPGDATNYLGGIGDVLQDKSHPTSMDLSHLGALQEVALYVDDRQIRRVTYSVELAESASYSVRVSILDGW
ncbi:hypothetical protein [Micromonospora sp. RTP1Z1]|uniref:hypothetical protein n=1 Tax=Micromonospora sp. RTP1Z1 TaxID=2994043 RepID=UPI0029C8D079|nr:hypothetical protein [Micromonospora sp. RTP1Z1]